jgi:sigma-B regulation protein RsbU (phosphoserine phosphatase)
LGIDSDVQYAEYESRAVGRGDLLILGTDGIWETRNPEGELFGKNRLREVIRSLGNRPVSEIAKALEEHLDMYRGRFNPEDDITFVLIRLK